MALAVCLLFDPVTDRAVRKLWARLETYDGVDTPLTHTHGHHVPHLSYAVLRTFDVAAVHAAMGALPPGPPLALRFDAVGLFRRRRAALMPAASAALLARQAAVVAAALGTGADLHHHYRPDAWIPHCSIATGVRRARIGDLTTGAFDVLPLHGVAEHAALVDSATGERWPLPHLV
ncbi:MAG TPA: 2'-5' RNA ligase family protein [Dermatophilaceae bacterium]|nr:2'-5' RNA ligase family protein [Dermatophilaceae bacterium]